MVTRPQTEVRAASLCCLCKHRSGCSHPAQMQPRGHVFFVPHSQPLPPASAFPALLWSHATGQMGPMWALSLYRGVDCGVQVPSESRAASDALAERVPAVAELSPQSTVELRCEVSWARVFTCLRQGHMPGWETRQPLEQSSVRPPSCPESKPPQTCFSPAESSLPTALLFVRPTGVPVSSRGSSSRCWTPGTGSPTCGLNCSLPRVISAHVISLFL